MGQASQACLQSGWQVGQQSPVTRVSDSPSAQPGVMQALGSHAAPPAPLAAPELPALELAPPLPERPPTATVLPSSGTSMNVRQRPPQALTSQVLMTTA